jgi:hypothetical protein
MSDETVDPAAHGKAVARLQGHGLELGVSLDYGGGISEPSIKTPGNPLEHRRRPSHTLRFGSWPSYAELGFPQL